jgi:hypothetical protein
MAGISPSYRIGPSDFFNGTDLQADGATLNDQVNRLDGLIKDAGTKVSDDTWNAWVDYVKQWRDFYSNTLPGFFVALNDSNRDQLIQFESRLQSFVGQYQNETGGNVSDVVAVSSGTKDGIGDLLKNQLQPFLPSLNMTYVLIAVGVVVLGLYFFWPVIMRKRGAL